MDTPILDFVQQYAEQTPARFHMPGHKGKGILGAEAYDITEIAGADELFEAEGIIARSEANASRLFGAPTFYSAAGSTLCIQAMLYLALQWNRHTEKTAAAASAVRPPFILAARNAHKAFVNAAALLDLDICWLYPEHTDVTAAPYYTCPVTAEQIRRTLEQMPHRPAAVYLTSPDYLGNLCDIQAIADVCHDFDVLLLVDNAHGAYLHFLEKSLHPVDLGADLCCASAHKTLPVLTGGAYLHIGDGSFPGQQAFFASRAKEAMALFASSSPSYLLLASLDACNAELENFPVRLAGFLEKTEKIKKTLQASGYELQGEEPLKVTLHVASGYELAEYLQARGIHPEFADPDYVVFMLSPANSSEDLQRLQDVLTEYGREHPTRSCRMAPDPGRPARVCLPREAILAEKETVPVQEALGRVSAAAAVSCPPAVPIVVSGERIGREALTCFSYYGITYITVVRE